MTASRVQIIGGGPAGLYVGNLLKQRHPSWDVQLSERLPPSDTYGFGVGLTARTLRNLQLADPDSKRAVVDAGYEPGTVTMQTFADAVSWDWGAHNGALTLARSSLLEVLQTAAERAGVRIETGRERTLADCDADLVIAADGSSSLTRAALGDSIGAQVGTGRMLYIWVGLNRALPGNLFVPVRTDHGVFVAHAYPYAHDRSTMVIEVDEATWRAAGLGEPREYMSPGDSDEPALAYLQDAFQSHLMGGSLIGNRSRWIRYDTVRCDRWSTDNTVLMGDAARTAHYSLGSGTKLALEDAITLSDVLDSLDDLPDRLAEYERRRRPSADRLQRLAHRSHLWWEGFLERAHRPAAGVTLAYLSRGGNVTLRSAIQTQPDVTAQALAEYAGHAADVEESDGADVTRWVLTQTYSSPRLCAGSRVLAGSLGGVSRSGWNREVVVRRPGCAEHDRTGEDESAVLHVLHVEIEDWMGPKADEFIRRCRVLLHEGADGVVLSGAASREAVLNRLSLGERIKLKTSAIVAIEAPAESIDDLVDGLVAQRTDFVMVQDQEEL